MNPTDQPKELNSIDPKWVEVHCNVFKLKITKCNDFSWCEAIENKDRRNHKGKLPSSTIPIEKKQRKWHPVS